MRSAIWRTFLVLLLAAAVKPAFATTYTLPAAIGSGSFSNCSFSSGTTYICSGSISIGNNDTITFSSNMILQITGSFALGNNSSIDGSGYSVTISTNGDIAIGNSLASSVNFNAGGNFSTGNTATINGNISAGGDISTGNSATVTGNISATGDVSLGSGSTVNGNVDAGGNLSVSSGTITGSCTYQTTNYTCSGGTGAASFTVAVSTTSASSCSIAGGTPAAPWITITAKNSSGTIVTGYTGTVTISGIGSGTLSKKTANGTLSGTSYTFASADSGIAVLYLTDPSAETVTPSVTDGTASGTSSSSITFSDNVLVISDADTLTPTYQPVAGRIHKLTAAVWSKDASSGTCSVNTKVSSAVSAKIWLTAGSNHPAGASAPVVSTSGSCPGTVTLLATTPASDNISLAFSSGTSTFYLCTSDVGQYSININASSLPGSAKNTTSSNTFTVIPFAVVVSGVKQGSTDNTGASTSTGTVFTTAGTAFQATVAAYLWNSAGDSNNDGVPDSGVLLTNAIAGGTVPRYAQTVTLSDVVNTPSAASGGTSGSGLANGTVSVTGGSTTVSNLSYPEVGSFTLSAIPASNYLGSASLSSRVLIYATTSTSPSNVVGRFKAHHFTTTITPGCTLSSGSFTYSGQPFTVVVTAVNEAGTTTRNYDNALGFGNAVTLAPNPTTAGTLSTTSINLSSGTQSLSETLTMASWTAPVSATIRAADSVDTTITSTSGTEGNSVIFEIGRVRMLNASGSERADLPMTMRVEYWKDATYGWTLNSSDSCTGDTSLSSANAVSLNTPTNVSMPAAAITAMCAYDSGSPGASGIGCAAAGTPSNQFLKGGVSGFAGNFQLNFRAPGSGNTGTMTVMANVPTWLQYKWKGTTADNPSAKATFGQPKDSKVIFRREMY